MGRGAPQCSPLGYAETGRSSGWPCAPTVLTRHYRRIGDSLESLKNGKMTGPERGGRRGSAPPGLGLSAPLFARATQPRRLVASVGAGGRTMLLMMVVLFVMLARYWACASRAGWGSKAGRAQGACDGQGAKQG